MVETDYYRILDVPRDASPEEIKAGYRRAVRTCHPDVCNDADAEKRFREATGAYEVLSDPDQREIYDRLTSPAGPARRPAEDDTPRETGGISDGEQPAGPKTSRGKSFLRMSLEEILQSLRGGQDAESLPRSGRDIEYPLTIEFLEAAMGTTRSLRVEQPGDDGQETVETLKVRIPPGVRTGQIVRVRGRGGKGTETCGDLRIRVSVREHPYFRREGNDLHVDIPIGIGEAVLGGKVDVPTTEGTMQVTVPPGTPSGRKLRLRGRGIAPKDKAPGDLYACIEIVPPRAVPEPALESIRRFVELTNEDPREESPWR